MTGTSTLVAVRALERSASCCELPTAATSNTRRGAESKIALADGADVASGCTVKIRGVAVGRGVGVGVGRGVGPGVVKALGVSLGPISAVGVGIVDLEQMAPLLGFDLSEPLRIVSYHSYDDMRAALPYRTGILGGSIRLEGIAFGDERVVLIPGFDSSVEGITSHEIVHLAIAEVTGRAHNRVPAWLKEGLAEFGSLEPGAEYDEALRLAILRNSVNPLSTLDTFWRSADYIVTAYGQGHSVIRYLVSNYGEAKVAELMQAIRGSFGIDEALMQVYGFDQYGLDVEWRESVGLKPLPRPEERDLPALPEPTTAPTTVPTPTPTPVRPNPTPTSLPSPKSPPTATHASSTPTLKPSQPPVRPTPTPEPTIVGTVKDEGGGGPSTGCTAPGGRSGSTSGDLAMIALLAGPLAMLVFRFRRR